LKICSTHQTVLLSNQEFVRLTTRNCNIGHYVRLTTIAPEELCYIFWLCVCSLCYPARKGIGGRACRKARRS